MHNCAILIEVRRIRGKDLEKIFHRIQGELGTYYKDESIDDVKHETWHVLLAVRNEACGLIECKQLKKKVADRLLEAKRTGLGVGRTKILSL